MVTGMQLCAICAWRATCQKKFSVSGRDMRCADFTEDITISKSGDNPDKDKSANNNDK